MKSGSFAPRSLLVFATTLAMLPWLGAAADATPSPRGPVFTLLEENDLVVNTDRHYTQGIKLSFLHREGELPFGSGLLHTNLPALAFTRESGRFGYSIGQSIFTPADVTAVNPPPDDRPYAGWIFLGAILQRRGVSWGRPALEDFEAEYGWIGPSSRAREAQTWVHEIRGFEVPRGWSHQLENEPDLRLKYSRAVRWVARDISLFGFDLTPHAGFSLGNVDTSLRAGARWRLGVNLPDDFGVQSIDALATTAGGWAASDRHRWGAYVFAGAEGRVVFRNAFLDGNLFHDSPSVDRKWLVGDLMVGFAAVLNRLEVGYAQYYRSPEFFGQTEHDSFGAVFARIKF